MYLAIITLPLLGSIASGLFGRKIGVTGAQLITSSLVILTTLLAIAAYFEAVSMLLPILIVSCLVHIYSIGYMSHDPHNQRFFSYLSLFTWFMIILVTSENLLLMFVG
ncbi:NADH-ubiquinone oxidoreductase [Tuber indicum]|nr:NADH-ubiquinone oxidoreductase [Tuber indicum]